MSEGKEQRDRSNVAVTSKCMTSGLVLLSRMYTSLDVDEFLSCPVFSHV